MQIVKESRSGIVYLRDGKIVHAESEAARGIEALLEIVAWDLIEFAHDGSVRAPETISMPGDEALIQAVVRHKEKKSPEDAPPEFEQPRAPERAPLPTKRGFFGAFRRS